MDYYDELTQKCAEKIARDGLDAVVELPATDLLILIAKAVMSRLPIVIKDSTVQPFETVSTTTNDKYWILEGPSPFVAKW